MVSSVAVTDLPSSMASRALCSVLIWRKPGRDDAGRRAAAGQGLVELGLDLAGAAREGGVDERIERQRRGVGHHRDHVVELDPFLAARIEGELADLAARGEPVAAEQRSERGAGLGRDREPGLAHLVIDQTLDIAIAIRVTGQRHRIGGALADRRAAAHCA